MPGAIDIADWLFAQPEFDEVVRPSGVRFVGLCNQTLVGFDTEKSAVERTRSLSPKFKLQLPNDFPIDEIDVEFLPLPDEPPEDDALVQSVVEKAKSSLFYSNSDLVVVSFDVSKKLIRYIHSEISHYFRIDPNAPPKEPSVGAWPYMIALRYLASFVVKHLAVYSNICKVGSFNLQEGYVSVGSEISETRSYSSPAAYISQIETERGIRLLRELDFKKNWEFYANLKGTFTGNPKSSIEIAVSNLTDLFDESYDQSGARNLIWGFAGLEALLADSESSIGSQLRQKLVALFGNQVDISDFEKEISDIYRFRSKIIHGNAKSGSVLKNLSGNFFGGPDEVKETRVAIWLLVAVMQYCFQNHQTELKFKTVVL